MLILNLKRDKFLIMCRKNVFFDSRVKGVIIDKLNIVDIDSDYYKLIVDEK